LLAAICDAAIPTGDLQLIWDELNKSVTGYKVYRVDGGSHNLLGAATGTARYYLVNKQSGGYANQCFAVEAYVGSQTSADSSHYCYAPGATATTLSLKPSHTVTKVIWLSPSNEACSGPTPMPGSAYFKAANRDFGSAFTAFFPWLLNEKGTQSGRSVDGVYAGYEQVVWNRKGICKGGKYTVGLSYAQITAFGVAVFDLDLKTLAKHKLYSATMTLKPLQTVGFASGKTTLSSGRWCHTYVGSAGPNLTSDAPSAFGAAAVAPREASINAISLVSDWIKYGINYGFLVAPPSPPPPPYWSYPYGAPTGSDACLTKFSTPSLQLVYF